MNVLGEPIMHALYRAFGRALAVSMVVLVAATAGDEAPTVLDADGRLSDAFIAEVRRHDETQWMQRYTVGLTKHILDYARVISDDEDPPLEGWSGSLEANHDTGASHFTED